VGGLRELAASGRIVSSPAGATGALAVVQAGDANLDGEINADDYALIDFNANR
jgi:hypothetical protein